MTDLEGERHTIEDRQLIAETTDLRVQILTLANGQDVPWHYHTVVTDSFTCLEGPMVVQTRTGDADHELQPGDTFAVPPKTVHRVAGKNGGRCRFVIVQGIGAYDFIPVEG
ncbi:MAG: cupin domain-containing protein [Kiloniellales bacterium]